MIVGASPHKVDVECGHPFAGPSGELLSLMIDQAELDRQDCYITSILKCRPPANRPGLAGELSNCWQMWLRKELRLVKPKIVVVLGKEAYNTIIKERGGFEHGRKILSKKGRTFLVGYHPAHFLRKGDPSTFVSLGSDIRETLDSLSGGTSLTTT